MTAAVLLALPVPEPTQAGTVTGSPGPPLAYREPRGLCSSSASGAKLLKCLRVGTLYGHRMDLPVLRLTDGLALAVTVPVGSCVTQP